MISLQIIQKAASLLERDEAIALVTVVRTLGSTPGRPGYTMLVWQGQQTLGTVGGGLVEAEMIREAGARLPMPGCATFRFNLGAVPDDERGICGGTVEFLIETFHSESLPLFRDLVQTFDRREPALLLSAVSPEGMPQKRLFLAAELSTSAPAELAPDIVAAMETMAAGTGGAVRVCVGETDMFIQSLAQSPDLVLFGAGHLTYHIARFAQAVHFRVVVFDDRADYAHRERFPAADRVIVADFADVLGQVRLDEDSYVVIVTRGHKHDEVVLDQVLKTQATYVGMIGSKQKTRTILDRLRQRGCPVERLDSVYSPVGLAIGAVTPEEIALSVVCELVKIRRRGHTAEVGHMTLRGAGGKP